jgi:peptide/nickel transport system permease protein
MAEAIREHYGLNDPLPLQYINWIVGIVTRGDFGFSFYYNRDVGQVVAERLPRTILLALTCHLLASIIGITLGIIAATRQYSWADQLLSAFSFIGMTVPRFLLALIMLYILAFKLDAQNFGTFFSAQYGGAPWSWAKFVDLVQHVWPVVLIATFGGLAYNMRVMRANLLDTLNAQYIETARAKGLTESAVIMRHAVPNALHPLIAYQGVVLPYMLTGEIEVAIVFSLATVGPAIVGSMAAGDIYVTATFMLVLAATLIVGNIISDILLSVLDPRIRLGGHAA